MSSQCKDYIFIRNHNPKSNGYRSSPGKERMIWVYVGGSSTEQLLMEAVVAGLPLLAVRIVVLIGVVAAR